MEKTEKKTVAKISEETLRIENYLKNIPHGQELTYEQIEKETDVKMDTKGKTYLRTSCRRLKRLYSSIRGKGIKLGCAEIAMELATDRLGKIHNAIKRGAKTHEIIISDFYESLPSEQKKQVVYLNSFYNAARVNIESGKSYIKNARLIQLTNPILPENIK